MQERYQKKKIKGLYELSVAFADIQVLEKGQKLLATRTAADRPTDHTIPQVP